MWWDSWTSWPCRASCYAKEFFVYDYRYYKLTCVGTTSSNTKAPSQRPPIAGYVYVSPTSKEDMQLVSLPAGRGLPHDGGPFIRPSSRKGMRWCWFDGSAAGMHGDSMCIVSKTTTTVIIRVVSRFVRVTDSTTRCLCSTFR